METTLRLAAHLHIGEWVAMYDDKGNVLDRIEGKPGVYGYKADGTRIGGDFVRMQPGTAFPPHTHVGEHELYFIMGAGFVHIGDRDIAVAGGSLVHIPAELSHSVWVPDHFAGPLIFVAMGHPHKHVDAHDRMQVITQNHLPAHKTDLPQHADGSETSHR